MSTLQTTNLKNPSSGSNNIVLATDGSTTITTLNGTTITGTSVRGVVTSGTAVASTSGTAIDFTSIPSWVKRITVMFQGVSLNASANLLVQIGPSGGVETTGYTASSIYGGPSSGSATSTTGFLYISGNAGNVLSGCMTIVNLTGNTWLYNYMGGDGGSICIFGAGSKTTASVLSRVRITTTTGTDTFDAGTINILYEG